MRNRLSLSWSCLIAALLVAACAAPPPAEPGDLQHAGWHEWRLPGKRATRYTLQHDGARRVIRADADASASMLRRALRGDAPQPSRIRFSWRIDDLIAAADLRDAAAEDAPVRIVLAFDGDHARLAPRDRMLFELAHAVTGERPPYATLMYVWDNKAPRESVIHAARTDRIRKIVVESGADQRDRWRAYDRAIDEDFRRAFGEEPGPLIGIALMTDSDNTRSRARAWYGEVELFDPSGRKF